MVEKEKRYEVVDEILYQNVNEFRYSEEEVAEKTSTVPTFELKNCVVKYSNLSITPKKAGKANSIGIQLILDDVEFIKEDKDMRAKLAELRAEENPAIEGYKSIFKVVTRKLVEEKKFDEKYLGKYFTSFNIANKPQNPKIEENLVDEETGEIYDKQTTMFFAIKDRLTGEAINPKVVKVVDGVETETFISPKTKEATKHYISGGDIVNVTLRPYESENSKTGEWTLKYNPLKIEIVSSSFDRSGKSSRIPSQAPESNLGSLFGRVTKVAPKKPEYATEKAKKEVVAEAPKAEKPKSTKVVKEETKIAEDLSVLDTFDDLLG